MSRVLALNRLYVGYASKAVRSKLSSEQKDALTILEKELHLGEREEDGRLGYWLLHPYLANAIYQNWFSSRNIAVITEHLKIGIFDSLNFGERPGEQASPLWAITRIFREDTQEEIRKRIDRNVAINLLNEIYNDLARKFNIFPLFLLPVWLDIARLFPELKLVPSPTEMAVKYIKPSSIDELGLRITCHKLLLGFEFILSQKQKVKVIDSIIQVLAYDLKWHEWVPIAHHSLDVSKDIRFAQLIKEYVLVNMDNHNGAHLLTKCLKMWPYDQELVSFCTNILKKAPCSFAWGDLAKEIIYLDGEIIPEQADLWLNRYRKPQYILIALGAALRLHYPSYEKLSLDWAREWYRLLLANYVLEPLLDKRSSDPEVINWCEEWVLIGEGEKSHILQKLLQLKTVSHKTIELAINWLEKIGPEQSTWTFVWIALQNIESLQSFSFEYGFQWLINVPLKHKAWPYVWITLANKDVGKKELFDLGKNWLKTAGKTHLSWIDVWKRLKRKNPEDQELLELALDYIKQVDSLNAEWVIVWQEIFKEKHEDKSLLKIGLEWMKNEINHPSWPYVWKAFISTQKVDMEFLQLGLQWIEENELNQKAWPYVWQILIKEFSSDTKIISDGIEWLKQAENHHPAWTYIWLQLYKTQLSQHKNTSKALIYKELLRIKQ